MENKKVIINVGRQLGAGGVEIAKMLAYTFHASFYDKELLSLAAQESGFSPRFFEENDEQRGFLRALFHLHTSHLSDNSFYPSDFTQERLFEFQCAAIRKAADAGSCVFVGRCADYVLRDRHDIVNIFITANYSDRLLRICERRECDEETAKKLINKIENQRSSYYNYYTGKKWGYADSYDLCVNSSRLGLEGTAAYIEQFVNRWYGIERYNDTVEE